MEIIFNFYGIDISHQSTDIKVAIKDIFHNCRNNVDINTLIFLYSGQKIDGNLSISKIINNTDLERNKMNILVLDKKDELNSLLIKSKDIICPKCKEYAKIDISDYKILLQCKNGHTSDNIFLNEYENTQKIDIYKIICDECKTNNKGNSYKNIFYRCNGCKKNLCIKCKDKHNNENHNIINYDDKNYICDIHNDKFISYCKECNKNICLYCKNEHREHELINYEDILPNITEVKINIDKLRNDIDKFKLKIDNLINRLNKVKDIIEYYYNINKNICDSLNNKSVNYEILYSYNSINQSDILSDINDVIKNENKSFDKLNEIYNKMNSKFHDELTINYKINNNDTKVRLFGSNFIINNKNKCKMIIEGNEMEIKETFEINNLQIKLIGINNITNACQMFYCSSLHSIPDLPKWNTSNIKDMSQMFRECKSLVSFPDISNWDTSNVQDMNCIFAQCYSLQSLPDISRWDTRNVNNMSHLFWSCSLLQSLPDISKWNTDNVKKMACMFDGCSSLQSLPDISKWNTSNVIEMNYMF